MITTIQSMYPQNKCHFCQKDFLAVTSKNCTNDLCNHNYTVGDGWVDFKIADYSFRIYNKCTYIYNYRSSKLIKVNFLVLITLEDYLQVVEKSQKLQVFA